MYQTWTLLKVQHRRIHGGRVQTTALYEIEWKTTAGEEVRRLWKVFASPPRFLGNGKRVDEDTYSSGRYAAAAAKDGRRI